jgi:hypothetical protein
MDCSYQSLCRAEPRHIMKARLQCIPCGKTFTQRRAYTRHLASVGHTGTQKHMCKICGQKYSRKDNLHPHLFRAHAIEARDYPLFCALNPEALHALGAVGAPEDQQLLQDLLGPVLIPQVEVVVQNPPQVPISFQGPSLIPDPQFPTVNFEDLDINMDMLESALTMADLDLSPDLEEEEQTQELTN